jgi:hypothetical protein
MATLAAPRPRVGPPLIPHYSYDVIPTGGTSSAYYSFHGDLHGPDLQSLFDKITKVSTGFGDLLRRIITSEHIEEDWSYNPVSPVRIFQAKVAFVNVGPMPAMKMDFDD